MIKRWLAEEKGATAIEYALIATGIALLIAAAVYTFGLELSGFYDLLVTVFDA